MEDHEEQEVEFWRKLDEEGMSRSQMLKRSIAAAAGLTVLSSPAAALAAGRRRGAAAPPLKGTAANMRALIAGAKKEGHLNVIALPPDWANYGEIISTFSKKYGIPITSDNPDGSSAQENQAIVSLKGDPRAPDVVDVGPSFAVSGATAGPVREVLQQQLRDDPAGDEGHPRLLDGRLLGLDHDRLQRQPRQHAAQVVRRPAEVGLQEQGGAERQPAHVELGGGGRVRGRARERRLAQQRQPGRRLVRRSASRSATSSRCRRRRRRSPPARRRSRSTGTTTTSPT